jgi:tRNA-specific 2-thiouridylase
MLCNARIKFGAFYDYIGDKYDKVATGHYAQIEQQDSSQNFSVAHIRSSEADTLNILRSSDHKSETMPASNISGARKNFVEQSQQPTYRLKKTPDAIKDQTYFLSQLTQKQLSRALFPIGEYKKEAVRKLAEKFELPNAKRKDSQGICFLGKIPFDAFLKYHLGEKQGDLVEYETNKVLGEHPGFWYFTVGQRQGIGLSGGPWYVVKKDTTTNTIYIAHGEHKADQARDRFLVGNLNWFHEKPEDGAELAVKLRHGPKEHNCTIQWQDEKMLLVTLKEKDPGIAEGQFAVFYRREYCLGGGVIVD